MKENAKAYESSGEKFPREIGKLKLRSLLEGIEPGGKIFGTSLQIIDEIIEGSDGGGEIWHYENLAEQRSDGIINPDFSSGVDSATEAKVVRWNPNTVIHEEVTDETLENFVRGIFITREEEERGKGEKGLRSWLETIEKRIPKLLDGEKERIKMAVEKVLAERKRNN